MLGGYVEYHVYVRIADYPFPLRNFRLQLLRPPARVARKCRHFRVWIVFYFGNRVLRRCPEGKTPPVFVVRVVRAYRKAYRLATHRAAVENFHLFERRRNEFVRNFPQLSAARLVYRYPERAVLVVCLLYTSPSPRD